MRARQKPEEAGSTAKLDEALQRAEERIRAAGRIVEPESKGGRESAGLNDSSAAAHPQLTSKTAMLKHVFEERTTADLPAKRNWARLRSGLVILSFVAFAGFLVLRLLDKGHFGDHQVPVELQANAPGVQFTVDGHSTVSATVNLVPGAHQVEAAAPGFESQTKKITVSDTGLAPVVFALQSLLPSLRVTTPFKGAKYILDGDEPIAFDNGSIREDHLISGTHSLRILTGGDKQTFSLSFVTQAGTMPAIQDHSEIETISALITSSFKDSSRLFATRDWKVSLPDGSARAVAAGGMDFTELVATSEDGHIEKLIRSTSRAPLLAVLLRRLPPKIAVSVSANVPDAAIVINGRRSEQQLVHGQAAFSLFPGDYRVGLVERDYGDSAIQDVRLVEGSKTRPTPLQFVLKPVGNRALVEFGPEAREAVLLIDDAAVSPNRVGGGRVTALIRAGHHVITIKRKNFEDLLISRDFAAGETVNLGSASHK